MRTGRAALNLQRSRRRLRWWWWYKRWFCCIHLVVISFVFIIGRDIQFEKE